MSVKFAQRIIGLVVAVVLIFAQGQKAFALLTYDAGSSTATFIHDPDISDAVDQPALSATFVGSGTLTPRTNPKTFSPTNTMPATPAYQFSTKDTKSSTTNSVAKASVAQVTNSTTAAVKIQAGTGVTQVNPSQLYTGASQLKILVDTYWNADASGFGPPASGVASFAVGGTVGSGVNAFAKFEAQLDFFDETFVEIGSVDGSVDATAVGTPIRSQVFFSRVFRRTDTTNINPTTGVFSKTFSSSELFSDPYSEILGYLPGYTRVHVTGYILFQAKNDDSPSDIFLRDQAFAGSSTGTGVPEPASMLLASLSMAAAGAAALRRRRSVV